MVAYDGKMVDVQKLYPILEKETGLSREELFESLYREDGNDSFYRIEDIDIEEMLENPRTEKKKKKVYRAILDLMKQGKLPDCFYLHFWW